MSSHACRRLRDIVHGEPHDFRDASDAVDDDPVRVSDGEVELIWILGDETDIRKTRLEAGLQSMWHVVLRQIRIAKQGYFHTCQYSTDFLVICPM